MSEPSFPEVPSRRRSKLETYRSTITHWWTEDKSTRSICLALAQMGCTVAYETLRSWINREVRDGRLPERAKSRVGRPSRQTRAPVSLGLLPTGQPDDPSDTMQFLVWNLHAAKPLESGLLDAKVFALQETGIPLDEHHEPDYLAYARKLGRQRLRTFGDMDFYLLATWLKPWRTHPDFGKISWQMKVLRVAAKLRVVMLKAADLGGGKTPLPPRPDGLKPEE